MVKGTELFSHVVTIGGCDVSVLRSHKPVMVAATSGFRVGYLVGDEYRRNEVTLLLRQAIIQSDVQQKGACICMLVARSYRVKDGSKGIMSTTLKSSTCTRRQIQHCQMPICSRHGNGNPAIVSGRLYHMQLTWPQTAWALFHSG